MCIPDIPNEDFHNTIARSLYEVFDTMLNMNCALADSSDCSGQKPEVPTLGEEDVATVFVGSVGFVGGVNGVIYLYMKEHLANEAAKHITSLDPEDLDYDIVSDVCGELTNMFAGSFKNKLAEIGYDSKLTIPTVLSGDELFVTTLGVKKHLRQNFNMGEDQVVTDLVLAEPVTV